MLRNTVEATGFRMIPPARRRRSCLAPQIFFIVVFVPILCSGLATQSGTGFGPSKSLQLHTPDTSPQVQRLVQVLRQQGAELDGTEIGTDVVTGIRGLYATKHWTKDKIICKIPSDMALALSDPAQKGEDAPSLAHGGANFLKLYQKNEQASKQWSFYLDCLPQPEQIPRTPDFYADEELNLLEFPRIVAAAKKRKEEIKQVAAETGIDTSEIQRATAMVSSRAFPLAVAEADKDLQTDVGDIALDERGQVMTKAGERKFIAFCVRTLIWPITNRNNATPNGRYWIQKRTKPTLR